MIVYKVDYTHSIQVSDKHLLRPNMASKALKLIRTSQNWLVLILKHSGKARATKVKNNETCPV